MYLQQTTWGDIWPYGYVQDKAGEAWKLVDEKDGWILLQNAQGEQRSMLRPADHVPVTALLYTEGEAWRAIYTVFPGAQIIEIRQTGAS